jgi:Tol biopolymer transport system component
MAGLRVGRNGLLVAVALLVAGTWGSATADAQVTRIDVNADGVPGNAPSLYPIVSFDGRYVVFTSGATNLVPGDTNDAFDFFRYDRQTGEITRVAPPFARPIQARARPIAISHDGRWLLFTDFEPGWVADDSNNLEDVFLYDFTTSQIRRVSVGPGGVQANGASRAESMSVDGRYIAFFSFATNIGPQELANGSFSQAYVYDRETGETVQVSYGVGRVPANGASRRVTISPDGEWVAFASDATNLSTTPDLNVQPDIYLSRWRTGEVFQVAPGQRAPDGPSNVGVPTWNATLVEFASRATNIVPGGDATLEDLYVWDRASDTASLAALAIPPPMPGDGIGQSAGPLSISLHGRYLTRVQAGPRRQRHVVHHDRVEERSTLITTFVTADWQMSLNGQFVVYNDATGAVYIHDLNVAPDGLLPTADADADGLPNGWEEQFGLNPALAVLDDGPDGDPDHDGATNAQERAANTHPRGLHTRYFAEGVTNSFFQTRFALFNPASTPAIVWMRFLRDDGVTVTQAVNMPGRTRRTVLAEGVSGLGGRSFSTLIESDVAVVVDRTVWWDASGYGAHSETSLASPAAQWFLAEGSTSGPFALFYLLQNPQPTSVDVVVRYVRPLGLPFIEKTYTLPPASRTTIAVDGEAPELANTDVAAVITATAPIVVERAMYLDRPGEPFGAGHGSAGVTVSATSWFFAEGATGSYFDLFLLLLNPSEQTARVDVRYFTSTGDTYLKGYTVLPNSRKTIWVDDEDIPAFGHALANVAVAMEVRSIDAVPLVVERTMWWPDGNWQEAHNVVGAIDRGPRWAIADGETGGDRAADMFILLANMSNVAGDVLVTVVDEDGASQAKIFTVNGSTRVNIHVLEEFSTSGRPFGVLIEALGPDPIPLVVERATYWDANGVTWAAGTSALATRLP